MIAAKILGEPGKPGDFANDNSVTFSEPGTMDKAIAFMCDMLSENRIILLSIPKCTIRNESPCLLENPQGVQRSMKY